MTSRDELIDAGAKEIASHRSASGGGWERDEDVWLKYRGFAEWVLNAVEGLIREDERQRMADLARKVPGGGIIDVRGLRAAVAALPSRGLEIPHDTNMPEALVWASDVLALLDGGTES